MDGVLADFEKQYTEWFGPLYINEEVWQRNKIVFVEREGYANLKLLPDARILIDWVNDNFSNVEILSATGCSRDPESHIIVCQQKQKWLDKMGISWKANFSGSGAKKADFYHPYDVLIDDTDKCLIPWVKRGGLGIKHFNAENTIRLLQGIY